MSTRDVAQEVRKNGKSTLAQDIALDKIAESKTNPRKRFDESKLRELTENVKAHGVLQPILVRPLANGKAHRYELVARARRYRASRAAGRDSIPARVVALTDAEALEVQCIENLLTTLKSKLSAVLTRCRPRRNRPARGRASPLRLPKMEP
ncbi:MAG TPA: ParB/RepB/Spo0J family partition protein [Terriglobales bacterium]